MNARALLLLFLVAATPLPGRSETVRVASWNIQSDGNDPYVIARQLKQLDRYDAYCLQEVQLYNVDHYVKAIRDAHGRGYTYILSATGDTDHLLTIFDETQLVLLEARELFRHGANRLNDWHHRSPLALKLRIGRDGDEFFLINVHMADDDPRLLREQAIGLRDWGRDSGLLAMAVGEFGFDYDVNAAQGNEAFDAFTSDSNWQWIKPPRFVATVWSDQNNDGVEDRPYTYLDFGFLSLPNDWPRTRNPRTSARVITRNGDLPDDDTTSDHRPLEFVVSW